MLTLYLTWLTTLISTVSSSLAYMVGPGYLPLTVTMGLLEHNLEVFFCTTYETHRRLSRVLLRTCFHQVKTVTTLSQVWWLPQPTTPLTLCCLIKFCLFIYNKPIIISFKNILWIMFRFKSWGFDELTLCQFYLSSTFFKLFRC